jgi:mersacidin/lichenicidin family type 2 lantibiotic
MPNEDIIRAWKDENYFHDLTDEQRANIPDHPAGKLQDLSPEEMSQILGGEDLALRHGTNYAQCGTGPASIRGCGQQSVVYTQCGSVGIACTVINCAPAMTKSEVCGSGIVVCNYTIRRHGCHSQSTRTFNCPKF